MLEVCHEEGILCEDEGARIVGVVVVPTDELVVSIGEGINSECLVRVV